MMQCSALTLIFYDGSSLSFSVDVLVNPSTPNKRTMSTYPRKLLLGTPPLTMFCDHVDPHSNHRRQTHSPAILYKPSTLEPILLTEEAHRLLRHVRRGLEG